MLVGQTTEKFVYQRKAGNDKVRELKRCITGVFTSVRKQ